MVNVDSSGKAKKSPLQFVTMDFELKPLQDQMFRHTREHGSSKKQQTEQFRSCARDLEIKKAHKGIKKFRLQVRNAKPVKRLSTMLYAVKKYFRHFSRSRPQDPHALPVDKIGAIQLTLAAVETGLTDLLKNESLETVHVLKQYREMITEQVNGLETLESSEKTPLASDTPRPGPGITKHVNTLFRKLDTLFLHYKSDQSNLIRLKKHFIILRLVLQKYENCKVETFRRTQLAILESKGKHYPGPYTTSRAPSAGGPQHPGRATTKVSMQQLTGQLETLRAYKNHLLQYFYETEERFWTYALRLQKLVNPSSAWTDFALFLEQGRAEPTVTPYYTFSSTTTLEVLLNTKIVHGKTTAVGRVLRDLFVHSGAWEQFQTYKTKKLPPLPSGSPISCPSPALYPPEISSSKSTANGNGPRTTSPGPDQPQYQGLDFTYAGKNWHIQLTERTSRDVLAAVGNLLLFESQRRLLEVFCVGYLKRNPLKAVNLLFTKQIPGRLVQEVLYTLYTGNQFELQSYVKKRMNNRSQPSPGTGVPLPVQEGSGEFIKTILTHHPLRIDLIYVLVTVRARLDQIILKLYKGYNVIVVSDETHPGLFTETDTGKTPTWRALPESPSQKEEMIAFLQQEEKDEPANKGSGNLSPRQNNHLATKGQKVVKKLTGTHPGSTVLTNAPPVRPCEVPLRLHYKNEKRYFVRALLHSATFVRPYPGTTNERVALTWDKTIKKSDGVKTNWQTFIQVVLDILSDPGQYEHFRTGTTKMRSTLYADLVSISKDQSQNNRGQAKGQHQYTPISFYLGKPPVFHTLTFENTNREKAASSALFLTLPLAEDQEAKPVKDQRSLLLTTKLFAPKNQHLTFQLPNWFAERANRYQTKIDRLTALTTELKRNAATLTSHELAARLQKTFPVTSYQLRYPLQVWYALLLKNGWRPAEAGSVDYATLSALNNPELGPKAFDDLLKAYYLSLALIRIHSWSLRKERFEHLDDLLQRSLLKERPPANVPADDLSEAKTFSGKKPPPKEQIGLKTARLLVTRPNKLVLQAVFAIRPNTLTKDSTPRPILTLVTPDLQTVPITTTGITTVGVDTGSRKLTTLAYPLVSEPFKANQILHRSQLSPSILTYLQESGTEEFQSTTLAHCPPGTPHQDSGTAPKNDLSIPPDRQFFSLAWGTFFTSLPKTVRGYNRNKLYNHFQRLAQKRGLSNPTFTVEEVLHQLTQKQPTKWLSHCNNILLKTQRVINTNIKRCGAETAELLNYLQVSPHNVLFEAGRQFMGVTAGKGALSRTFALSRFALYRTALDSSYHQLYRTGTPGVGRAVNPQSSRRCPVSTKDPVVVGRYHNADFVVDEAGERVRCLNKAHQYQCALLSAVAWEWNRDLAAAMILSQKK